MAKSNIHPTAIIEPGAEIGENVTIEPYAIVKSTVKIGDGVTLKSHAYIDGNTTIGSHTTIWPFVSIGTKTQDLKFRGAKTYVVIGKNTEIREFTTINSSTCEGSTVRVGDNCLIMASCHIAHHCEVGNHVIMSNNSLLAGHVVVEDFCNYWGNDPCPSIYPHRLSRHGRRNESDHWMYRLTRLVEGFPTAWVGLIRIGLKRRQFPFQARKALATAYRLVYRSKLHLDEALERIEDELPSLPEIRHFVQFCRSTKRGLIGMQGIHQGISNKRIFTNKEEFEPSAEDLLVEMGAGI